MATDTKTRGAGVDGKRLAKLESGVAALAIVLTANSFELIEGADPIEAAIKAIKSLLTERSAAVAAASEAGKRILELEEENGELKTDVEELASARNTLANELAAQGEAQGDPEIAPPPAVEPEPPVAEARERSAAARDVGPTFGSLAHGEIRQAVDAGAAFEVAFSNGDYEIVDFPPVAIAAADMRRVDGSRFALTKPINIRGAERPERLHGAGLLIEGVQVAYCPFEPPSVVHPGHEWAINLIF